MPANANLGIGITMFLRDEFSGPAAKIRTAAASMKKTVDDIYDEQLRYTRNLSSGIAMVGGAALMGLGRAIKKGAEFNTNLRFTGIVTSATAEETKKLGNLAQNLATKYMFSSDQIIMGMKEMGKAGMNATETMVNMTAAINLAGSTDTDLAQTTDTMITIMKQWRIEMSQAGNVADMLSYAVNASVIDMPDLAEAMKYAGSTAQDLRIDISEVTAMIMALGQAGMKGSMAGVAVENALRYIGRAVGKYGTGQQQKALSDLGISREDVVDAKGNMRSMVEILDVLKAKMIDVYSEEGGGVEKQSALTAIFGVRGKRSASLLLRNLDQYKQYLNDVNTKSKGFAGRTTLDMMKELGNQLKTLGAAWKVVGQALAQAISPIVKPLVSILKVIAQVISWILKIPYVGTMLASGVVGFIAIKTVSMAFRAVLSGILLIQRQLAGSMTLLSTNTILGYSRMTAAARTYHMTAGSMGIAGPLMSRGNRTGIGVNAAGRYINKSTGRFVSASVAGAAASRVGLMGGLNSRLMARLGTGIAGKAVGFLGGPVGIALSFIIPGLLGAIISAVNKNRKATEDINNTLDSQGNIISGGGGQRYINAIEFIQKNKVRLQSMQELAVPGSQRQILDKDYIKTVQDLLAQMVNGGTEGTTVILNIDGETVASKVVKRVGRQLNNRSFIPNQ